MHEWSIAEGIVTTLLESFKDQKVLEVEIKIGELRDLNIEVLREAISILSKGTNLEDSRFSLVVSKAVFKCLSCGEKWMMDKALEILGEMLDASRYIIEEGELEPPIHFIPSLVAGLQKCPRCGRIDIEIESGKELEISKVYLSQ
ncbi:MAG: hydrogenase/urease maturation nickel metallochaperone HypA [Thaumarchaeota archaeon]|jgi:hydrogenase nickel incorporation protein HypA/HybF|nr:hydrogenase/urease maturation nickel metallochaperone HypA [Candidatus Geocrenenecus arthurdayi]MCL7389294.1 hydrogenase/urease maturation nickel metallochaperone HypA [Candidatus Geocrenenecus arthurdayi]MCL7391550.1 hydrogenase/urease maturation nickel metallochaperone HypA [Candidatus Geocrenenecus arthurdayi]MCL7396887.1 hydrogenase/urease maturation nickel metallochaperone HypA [Candidatus Geocrenenecus arthurdayi]